MARQHLTFKSKPELGKSKLTNLKQPKPHNTNRQIRQIQTIFHQTTSAFERTRMLYNNTVNRKPKSTTLFTDIRLNS